eukprot:Nk52_evm85s2118 gene=Nk52_evmTU85s2118
MAALRVIDGLISDVTQLHNEVKKRYPNVKQACETALEKLTQLKQRPHARGDESSGNNNENNAVTMQEISECDVLLKPFVLGCESKQVKQVQISLGSLQKLIYNEAIAEDSVEVVLNCLWTLMEAGIEEVRVLQTVIYFITSNDLVMGDFAAKSLVLCFRMFTAKDPVTSNTAAATLAQIVAAMYDRVGKEYNDLKIKGEQGLPGESLPSDSRRVSSFHRKSISSLPPAASDAYLLLQDLCEITNGDHPFWLVGISEMSRNFGLEIIESIVKSHAAVFTMYAPLTELLKGKVCPLIIKLFSPGAKTAGSVSQYSSEDSQILPFPLLVRLLRVIVSLLKFHYAALVTESEIFLSMLVKLLDIDKPLWYRTLVSETFRDVCCYPYLLRSFCDGTDSSEDREDCTSRVFQDVLAGLSSFIRTLMSSGNLQPVMPAQTSRNTFLEMLDKFEPPVITESYSSSVVLSCLLDIINSINFLVASSLWDDFDETKYIFSNLGTIIATEGDHKMVSMKKADSNSCLFTSDECNSSVVDMGLECVFMDREVITEREMEEIGKAGIIGLEAGAELSKKQKAVLMNPKASVWVVLVQSSWSGLLASLSLLLSQSKKDEVCDVLLAAYSSFMHTCSILLLKTPRDAFLTSLCKNCLPPNIAANLMADTQSGPGNMTRQRSVVKGHVDDLVSQKHLKTIRCLLREARILCPVLSESWYIVLEALNLVDIVLDIQSGSGMSLKSLGNSTGSVNAAGALNLSDNGTQLERSALSVMFAGLFESSRELSSCAIEQLLMSLVKFSEETTAGDKSAKNVHMFALPQILFVANVNLFRIELVCPLIMPHLLHICNNQNPAVRDCGAEVVTKLVVSTVFSDEVSNAMPQDDVKKMMLKQLKRLSSCEFMDVRIKQVECLLQILQSSGGDSAKSIICFWDTVFSIVDEAVKNLPIVEDSQGANAARRDVISLGFQSVQLIVTDFLIALPIEYVTVCMHSIGNYALQTVDVNISLTAIGLLWNVSDFFNSEGKVISGYISRMSGESPEKGALVDMADLWMSLFRELSSVVVDTRPEVRKSASQTLFSTVSTHGSRLQEKTWQRLLCDVFFPLLESVKDLSEKACEESATGADNNGSGNNILVHHSRNTSSKQWDETKVIVLVGISKIFGDMLGLFVKTDDFSKSLDTILEFIEMNCVAESKEVSLSGAQAMDDLIKAAQSLMDRKPDNDSSLIWTSLWGKWVSIGKKISAVEVGQENETPTYVTPQVMFTNIVGCFSSLYMNLQVYSESAEGISAKRMKSLFDVLGAFSSYPFCTDFISDSENTTSLQASILDIVDSLQVTESNVPIIISSLVDFSLFVYGNAAVEYEETTGNRQGKKVKGNSPFTHVAFSKRAINMTRDKFRDNALAIVKTPSLLCKTLESFAKIAALKYSCPGKNLWRSAVKVFIEVAELGFKALYDSEELSGTIKDEAWRSYTNGIEVFVFSTNIPERELSVQERDQDEDLDVLVIDGLRKVMGPHVKDLGPETLSLLLDMLKRGSSHSELTPNGHGPSGTLPSGISGISHDIRTSIRESFAKSCFETMLQFSFVIDGDAKNISTPTSPRASDFASGSISSTAVDVLLSKCKDVLKSFVIDDKLTGKFPLPRARISEVILYIKAVGSVVKSLKKEMDERVLQQQGQCDAKYRRKEIMTILRLYPYIVDCVMSNDDEIKIILVDVLQSIGELMTSIY